MKPPTGRQSLREQALVGSATRAFREMTGPSEAVAAGHREEAPFHTFGSGEQQSTQAVPSWSNFFNRIESVSLPERGGNFRVYLAGSKGPLLFCLHGGGYTGMTWAVCAQQLAGNGYRVAAMDMRGHGETTADPAHDLSLTALVQDAIAVWQALYGEEKPPTVIVGHSMGGAVAVHAAKAKVISPLAGLVVIDVVEGSALAALPFMTNVLNQRPSSFASLQEAIHWATTSGLCKHADTAAITVPPMLRQGSPPHHAAHEHAHPAGHALHSIDESLADESPWSPTDSDAGVQPMDESTAEELPEPASGRWHWRTHLQSSQGFWEGWYRGLSDNFLSVTAPKVLIIADTNRLDTPLTIGQMQGKFQQVLLPQAGHAVHEDNAEQVAAVLVKFLQRNRVGEPPLTFPRPARQ